MLAKFRRYRPGHGTVVGYLALFIALGGTSYAVATGSIDSREIKNNTVRSKDIRNNGILGRDVRSGAIRSSDVANSSLLARDFAPGQLPAGPRGAQGPPGPAGQDGFGLLAYPFTEETVADGASADVAVDCPSGTSATGGDTLALDATDTDVTNQVLISQGFNFIDPIGWVASVTNNTGGDVTVIVNVACANAGSVLASNANKRQRR